MKEVYDNDEMSAEEVSSIVLEPAQQEVVVIGTKVIPGIGTGSFSYPVDYPTISCGWLCYYGHTALDIQNYYNRYGNVMLSTVVLWKKTAITISMATTWSSIITMVSVPIMDI